MELRYLLGLMRTGWRLIALSSLFAALAGVATTYVLSEDYAASTTILIRPRTNFAPSGKETLDYPVSLSIPVESVSQTYASIMTSEAVATRVVERLQLDSMSKPPDARWYVRAMHWVRDTAKSAILSAWAVARYGRVEPKDPYWKAVEDVLEALDASPVQDTYLFTLTATWSDPAMAALVADTSAGVFIEYVQDARRGEDGTSVGSLAGRLASLREDLQSARVELNEFRQEAESASLEHQLALRLDALSQFETTREDALRGLEESKAELAAAERQLAEQTRDVHSATTMARNPVLSELEAQLARDEVTLAGLRRTHQDAHPEIKALLARISAARGRMATEAEQVRDRDTSELSELYTQLQQRAQSARVAMGTLAARVAALDDSVGRYRADVSRLASRTERLAALSLEVEVLEGEYRLVSQKHAEARLEAAQEISEIRSLSAAIPPVYPEGPIKILYGGAALALGLLGSVCLILIADYVEPRVRSGEDVQQALGRPVLAVVRGGDDPSFPFAGDRGREEDGHDGRVAS